jgi:hypothetical protein
MVFKNRALLIEILVKIPNLKKDTIGKVNLSKHSKIGHVYLFKGVNKGRKEWENTKENVRRRRRMDSDIGRT